MKKVKEAWVKTNQRADGIKFYTAFIRFEGRIFWFIPIYYTYPIVQIWSESPKYPDGEFWWSEHEFFGNGFKFSKKDKAEHVLLEVIDKYLDQVQEKLDSKVIKQEKTPVSFGSFDH